MLSAQQAAVLIIGHRFRLTARDLVDLARLVRLFGLVDGGLGFGSDPVRGGLPPNLITREA